MCELETGLTWGDFMAVPLSGFAAFSLSHFPAFPLAGASFPSGSILTRLMRVPLASDGYRGARVTPEECKKALTNFRMRRTP